MKNHLSSLILMVFAALLLSSCGGSKSTTNTKKPTGVNFVESNSLQKILDKAANDDKLVFVDIYTTWCAPCKVMDEYVFSDKELKKYMDKNFVSYKVDAERGNGQTVALVYNATAYPTLLFLDKAGKVLERRDGSASISELKEMGNRALATQQ